MTSEVPIRQIGRTAVRMTTLGAGTASLGNLYRPISGDDAAETVATALELGIRYFDTAPHYGFGLSERRVGDALRGRPDAIVSTKVGRLLRPAPEADVAAERLGFVSPMQFEPAYDYSYDGILRSYEQSLQRLGLAKIDILLIHDIGRMTHGERHEETFAQLTESGGLDALRRLRDEKVVSAIGVGVNEVEICLELMGRLNLEVLLLAGRYTLLEQGALDQLLPRCVAEGVSVVIGGPFNSGILATGPSETSARYDYETAPPAVRERVKRLQKVCASHTVPLPAAALQFPLAHPAVASVIPGFASAAEVRAGVTHFQTAIPAALWSDLRNEGLIDPRAPIPSAAMDSTKQ